MPESTRTADPDLTPLAQDFDLVGELGREGGAQFLIARRKTEGKRRDDSGRVLIEIVRPPEGDESHALDHLASDTKLLSGLRHRRLVPIYEGRWLADDAFAVIREHVDDPSVADLLARGDTFTNTRTAAILREVHGLLQWAREQDVVHRRVTPDRLFLEPTSDRVRVTFGAGPVSRVRTVDATTEDVQTVVRLATAMLTGGIRADEAEGQTFAELRPDLPARLHEETVRLLEGSATDAELTLYLALIGMADPVAEGETERDRIRAEILEEQRVEREKLAKERADLERHVEEERKRLADEGEELRAAFAHEKAKLEREFAASQRLLDAERAELKRIIAAERAELLTKRETLVREVDARLAEIERAAAEDRAKVEELRVRIREAGEEELERKRAAALEELDDSEIRLTTGKYATPRFVAPKLSPLPNIAFRRDEHLKEGTPIEEPRLPAEPWTVTHVVQKLREPRRTPLPWKRWAVTGAVAAAILATAGYAVMVESRSGGYLDTQAASAPLPATRRVAGQPGAQPVVPVTPLTAADSTAAAATYSSAAGAVATPVPTDSATLRAQRDSVLRRVRADSIRRAAAGLLTSTRPDSAARRPATTGPRRQTRTDDQDLMMLSDSLSQSNGEVQEPDPPSLPEPTGSP